MVDVPSRAYQPIEKQHGTFKDCEARLPARMGFDVLYLCFWIEQGGCIFRVDNPHTKPLRFWGWLIDEVKTTHPEAIFLAEAFTRPKIQYHLAKRGFTQSYTYFAWRHTKEELTRYFTELTRTELQEYFRPNL